MIATVRRGGTAAGESSAPAAAAALDRRGDGSGTALPPDYRPTEDEPFMNPRQQAYFRRQLLDWKARLLLESMETLESLQEEGMNRPDLTERAALETDRAVELRTRDRERKLIAKIDAALARIADGSYGYCEDTGVPISLKRLEARPVATLSLEAQERHERAERNLGATAAGDRGS